MTTHPFSMLVYLFLLLRVYQAFSTKDTEVSVSLDVPTPGAGCLYPNRILAHIYSGGQHVEIQLSKTFSGNEEFIIIEPPQGVDQDSINYTDKQHLLEIQLTCLGTRLHVLGTLSLAEDTVLNLDGNSRLNYSDPSPDYNYMFTTKVPLPNVFEDINSKSEEHHRRREKRDTSEMFIDVLVLVGHSVYQRWEEYIRGNMTESTNSVDEQIKQHFYMLFNSVDLRFKSISSKYNIKVVGIIIQNAVESEWLNGVFGNLFGEQLIQLIENWTTSTSGLPRHDVAVVYERETLYSEEDTFSRHEFSQERTLCNSSSSVVAVSYQGEIGMDVRSTTRGIARALGAVEEGPASNCSDTDNLMSSNYTHLFSENSQIFSSCSHTLIQNYVDTLIRSSNVSRSCLTQPENVTEVTESLPGQVYSPDVQCNLIDGLESFYCHHADDASHSGICQHMYCYFPGSTMCYSRNAADGTTCGNKMWCIAGSCVNSSKAPEADPECIHGNQRQIGILAGARSCEYHVTSGLYQCYAHYLAVSCCTSCSESRLDRPDCSYGDKMNIVPNCSYSDCLVNINDTSYLDACCDTCRNVSTRATLSPTDQSTVSTIVTSSTASFSVEESAPTTLQDLPTESTNVITESNNVIDLSTTVSDLSTESSTERNLSTIVSGFTTKSNNEINVSTTDSDLSTESTNKINVSTTNFDLSAESTKGNVFITTVSDFTPESTNQNPLTTRIPDMQTESTNEDAVLTIISDMSTESTNEDDVSTIISDMSTESTNGDAVSTRISDMSTESTNGDAVSTRLSDMSTESTNGDAVSTRLSDMSTESTNGDAVSTRFSDMSTESTNEDAVSTRIADMSTETTNGDAVSTIISDMSTESTNGDAVSTRISDMSTESSNGDSVSTRIPDMSTESTNGDALSTRIADMSTESTNGDALSTRISDMSTESTNEDVASTRISDMSTETTNRDALSTRISDMSTESTNEDAVSTRISDMSTESTNEDVASTRISDMSTESTNGDALSTRIADMSTESTNGDALSTRISDMSTESTNGDALSTRIADTSTESTNGDALSTRISVMSTESTNEDALSTTTPTPPFVLSTASTNGNNLSTTTYFLDKSSALFSTEDSDGDDLAIGLGVGLTILLLLGLSGLTVLVLYKKKLFQVNPRGTKQPSDKPSWENNHLVVLTNSAPPSTKPPTKV